ncbi:MAG: hypothetical protein KA756_08320, partial [Steroidobacteraceae bacterium]|nr:hypothetical protein [Steroidobacteraceae bacterium]
MTAPHSARFVAWLLWLVAAPAMAADLTIARLFAAPDLSGPTLRSAAFSPDGRHITYLRAKDSAKD